MAAPLTGGFAVGETVALRPGVALPDWSLAPDPQARAALAASMAVAGRRERWAELTPDEDTVWQAVLRRLASHGDAPAAALARSTGHTAAELSALLQGLRRRDLLVLDAAGEVTAAYPFSALPTPHRVRPGDADRPPVHALCAIDALGAGGMLGLNSLIHSRCAGCGAAITLRTCAGGRALAAAEPATALVWSGLRYAGGCAATSGCALKPFLCSEAHLESWRTAADPGGTGHRLDLAVALQVGLALFVPMLLGPR